MAEDTKKASRVIFGNKEKKQFPDPEGLEREKPSSAIEGSTQPLGFETRLRAKFSEQANEIGMETRHRDEMKTKGMRQTFAKRSSVRPKHLQHPAPVQGGHYKQTPQMEKPHYEEYEKMENKTFTQFVTEAKRGRPRKLKPGEKADTEHLQDQLSKLTHPNHVIVHFADGTKHQIPRGHANKALQKLASLKPEHRAAHVEHMHSSHENFYKTLAGHPIPSKKKTITLAGPKLRKEETEVEEDYDPKAADRVSDMKYSEKSFRQASKKDPINSLWYKQNVDAFKKEAKKAQKKAVTGMDEEVEALDELSIYKMQAVSKEASRRNKDYSDPKGIKHQVYGAEVADDKIVKKAGKYDPSTAVKVVDKIKDKLKGMSMKKKMAEEAEHDDDGWYAHKEMHGKDAVSKEDWKKGIRKKPTVKKEEVESDEKKKKDHHKLLQKFRHRIDEIKAIKGTHATKLHAAKVIHPDKVGYAGKQTKPKVQNLRREDYAPLETGDKQDHVDQKTVDAKSRKQGAEKPKKPKMELTKEAWDLYDSLSEPNKAIFEKMDSAERDRLVDKYLKSGGKVSRGKYNKPRESEKPFPASKMKGSKWASTADSINRKNQGYRK